MAEATCTKHGPILCRLEWNSCALPALGADDGCFNSTPSPVTMPLSSELLAVFRFVDEPLGLEEFLFSHRKHKHFPAYSAFQCRSAKSMVAPVVRGRSKCAPRQGKNQLTSKSGSVLIWFLAVISFLNFFEIYPFPTIMVSSMPQRASIGNVALSGLPSAFSKSTSMSAITEKRSIINASTRHPSILRPTIHDVLSFRRDWHLFCDRIVSKFIVWTNLQFCLDTYDEELQAVIHKLHGVHSTHIQSVPVTETHKGEVVWDGIVEVFQLHGHPSATHAYAWTPRAANSSLASRPHSRRRRTFKAERSTRLPQIGSPTCRW